MLDNISGDGKDKLENFKQKPSRGRKHDVVSPWLNPSPVDECGEGAQSKGGSRKAAREVTMTTQWAGTNTHRHTDNRELTQQDGSEKKTANLLWQAWP